MTLACIPVGRHTVVGSDVVPVLARDKMTWKGRRREWRWEGGSSGGDAMWPDLLFTTVLQFTGPYKVERKGSLLPPSSF